MLGCDFALNLAHVQLAVFPPVSLSLLQNTKSHPMWHWWVSGLCNPFCYCTINLASTDLSLFIFGSIKSVRWALLHLGSPPALLVNLLPRPASHLSPTGTLAVSGAVITFIDCHWNIWSVHHCSIISAASPCLWVSRCPSVASASSPIAWNLPSVLHFG